MKAAAISASIAALALTIGPPVAAALGTLEPGAEKPWMLAGAILWFATAPVWLRGGRPAGNNREARRAGE